MSFLVIAGLTTHVARGQASETVVRIGSSGRTYFGTLRSTLRAEKRVWKVTTTPMLTAASNAIRTAVALGAQVACSGNLLGGTVTCEVEVTDVQRVAATSTTDGLGFLVTLALTISEV